uniref:Uncharacterized protein n=1 Tax=Arundo donax TaxID=35708 RepID=A0A0A8Z8F9_ARUDO
MTYHTLTFWNSGTVTPENFQTVWTSQFVTVGTCLHQRCYMICKLLVFS